MQTEKNLIWRVGDFPDFKELHSSYRGIASGSMWLAAEGFDVTQDQNLRRLGKQQPPSGGRGRATQNVNFDEKGIN